MNVFGENGKRLRYEHPKYKAIKTSLVMLSALLKTVMAVAPTAEEVTGFKASATEYAEFMLGNFEGYHFFNYEHVLICHAWEFLEKYGSLGAYSSILCEAFNALWKDFVLHHDARSGDTEEGLLHKMVAKANPAPAQV